MNNVFVYCEIEGTQVQEVSQELLTKGRKLANELRTCSLTLQLPTLTFWLTSSRRSSHRFA